jgi:hypothetical protein
MGSIWTRLDGTRRLMVGAVAGVVVVGVLATVVLARGNDLRRDAVGQWGCTVVDTNTQRPDQSPYQVGAPVPPPFDVLPDEMGDSGIYVLPYRAPEYIYRVPAADARVAVHEDGLVEIVGISYNRESIHTGRLSREDGLYVVRFDTDFPHHAIQIEQGTPRAEVLSWEGRYATKLFEVLVTWTDIGVDLHFSTGVTGYEARCTKLSDDPGPVMYSTNGEGL